MGRVHTPIIIVDDEPDICWALKNILQKNNFHLNTASSGMEALELVRQCRFRIAFVDAKLPDIEGLELARQIRAADPLVHVVIVSGYFYKDDVAIQEAIALGEISSFVSKPFDNPEIISIIGAIISS
ncbi:MAG: response regulator [Desulfobacteraceae bacterium]|nr:response regulator [Desulfobacteraceae bacterium]